MSFFKKTCLIFGMELIALLAMLEDPGPSFSGLDVWIYMDSNNSTSAVTRGDSDASVIAALVARVWELTHR